MPVDLQCRLDCLRASRSWERNQAIFVHVPKAAGFSISQALYGKALGHIKAKHIKAYAKADFERYFKFSFVRHPVDRYISALSYVRKNFDDLRGGPGLPPADVVTLDPVRFLDEWLLDTPATEANFVFQPQSDFIFDDDDILLVDYLGRYEDFDAEIARLVYRLSALTRLEKLNASGSGKLAFSFDDVDIRLRRIYPRDYALLGYE